MTSTTTRRMTCRELLPLLPSMNRPPADKRPDWPIALRLAGLWLIWSTWASSAGWILSAAGCLSGMGYFAASPFLFGSGWLWWKHSGPPRKTNWKFSNWRKKRQRLPLCFLLVALLSLAGALLHIPWSYDAVTYRLPRCLYWLAKGHWYWIGTIDGRLDYSSCGLEWQSVPLLLATGSDQFLFLLSFLPFLLLPGLTYLAGRTLQVERRPMLILMWLIPCAYCIALQCSGVCNDGYSVTYTVASLAFGGVAIRRGDQVACIFCGLAAALLTGAKLSNLPLILPLGILFLVAARKSEFFRSPALAGLVPMALASFLPLAVLCHVHTGNWTGDPHDQWGFRTGNPLAATTANLILSATDLTRPPVLIGTGTLNDVLNRIQESMPPLMKWLQDSHKMFTGINVGDMVYEGDSGAGFSIGIFLLVGTVSGLFIKSTTYKTPSALWQKVVVLSSVVSWIVLLSQLGSNHTPRNAISYLPLLIFAASGIPPLLKFLHSDHCATLALFAMASVIPVIILTPARPLIPLALLERVKTTAPVGRILEKYRTWEKFRDDLKPLRESIPADVTIVGYAGAFKDTNYGLWRPFGARIIREIGLPPNRPDQQPPVPAFVVGTEAGIHLRFGIPVEEWIRKEQKTIRYSFSRSITVDADSQQHSQTWYLFAPAKN